jgi:hypothetical protein
MEFQQAERLNASGELDMQTLAELGLDWAVDPTAMRQA